MEGKRAIYNWQMLLAVLLAVLILGETLWKEPIAFKELDVLYLITLPMATSMFGPYASIFPAIPYALSFAEEYNGGYIRFALIRSSRKKYIRKKIIAVALSGGIMMACAFGIIFLYTIYIGRPTEEGHLSEFYLYTIWKPIAQVFGGKLVLVLKTLLAFLFGMVWSSVCLFISALFLNRYVTLIGTYILYQTLWQVLADSIWNPVYLLRADTSGYTSFWEPVMIQLIVLMTLCLANGLVLRRRLNNA